MQGTIAQLITLTTYGNAFLRGAPQFDRSFYPNISTFQFDEYVRFVTLLFGRIRLPYARDPLAWLEKLKREGVRSLRMHYISTKQDDRMLVGFVGGGGRWLIEAMKPGSSDFWEADHAVGNSKRKDRRIWRVTYGRVGRNMESPPLTPADFSALRDKLNANLEAIAYFARTHKANDFAECFDAGRYQLTSTTPGKDRYGKDIGYGALAPRGLLPLPAAQLLAAAEAAWVFGAMGSWNDAWFVDNKNQAEYDRLSDELYALLNAAILAAANASATS